MILEIRTYTLKPGKMDDYWQLYRDLGAEVVAPGKKHLLGYYASDIGMLNQVVHIWQFRDMAERQALRDQMAAKPEWQAHLARIRPLMISQETQILKPSPVAHMSPFADTEDLIS